MRLGLFGGTFDPPHVGHLLAASDALEALALDRVIFVPASSHPFKGTAVGAPAEDRFRMVSLMVGADARFAVDRVEIDRKGLSFTVDTLVTFAARYPDATRMLLIGEDLVAELPTWRQAERLGELAEIVVLTRGCRSGEPAVTPAADAPFRRVATRRVDISSTEIRDRVRARRPIHGFVAPAVAEFIASNGLYR